MTEKIKESKSNKMKIKMTKEKTKVNNQEKVEKESSINEHDAISESSIEEQQQNEVTQLKLKIEELQNRLLRNQADLENYKKRTRIEKEEFAKYASVKLIESLLPAMDSFSRALQFSNENTNLESIVKGVEMVYRQIEEVLKNEGLQSIEAIGQSFNPEYHQAVMQVETPEFTSGAVVEELQKGYMLKGKVIRPSMVKVNS